LSKDTSFWPVKPPLTYKGDINFAKFNLRYTGFRPATLMNDQSIPSCIPSNISLGRYLPNTGRVDPKVMLSLMNVADNHYLARLSKPYTEI